MDAKILIKRLLTCSFILLLLAVSGLTGCATTSSTPAIQRYTVEPNAAASAINPGYHLALMSGNRRDASAGSVWVRQNECAPSPMIRLSAIGSNQLYKYWDFAGAFDPDQPFEVTLKKLGGGRDEGFSYLITVGEAEQKFFSMREIKTVANHTDSYELRRANSED